MSVNREWGSTNGSAYPDDKGVPKNELRQCSRGGKAVLKHRHKKKRRQRNRVVCQEEQE